MRCGPVIFFSTLLTFAMGHAAELDWGYNAENGPAAWSRINPDYALCEKGRNQSPVDLAGAVPSRKKPLVTHYAVPASDTFDTGRTVQIRFKPGNTLVLEDGEYQLKQIHFHAPSEHRLAGKSYPLEAHFYHEDKNGNMAVLAVFIERGKENRALARMEAAMPVGPGTAAALSLPITPGMLLPASHDLYRIAGSLTTPPCSEGVRWLILRQPLAASQKQISMLAAAVRHPNNRPVQALNGRLIMH